MIKAGSQFGMQLLWVLLLSAFFAWVCMEAYGRYAIVTGETSIHSFKTRFKFGKPLSIIIIFGIVFGQWNSLTGILRISSNAFYEVLVLFFSSLSQLRYWMVLALAVIINLIMYGFLLKGNYSFFEQILLWHR